MQKKSVCDHFPWESGSSNLLRNFPTFLLCMKANRYFPLICILVFCGCSPSEQKSAKELRGFKIFKAETTGLHFANTLTETPEFNRLNYEFFYNGGGVAAGDIDNDGLIDLYFTGNQVADKLYPNKGNMRFEDITEQAGISSSTDWHTGVAMVDVNCDGWLDIHVCRSGPFDESARTNLLYIK